MKKSLIALAAIAVSGAVFAQSSVTMSGIVDGNLSSVRTTIGATSLTQSGVNVDSGHQGNPKKGGLSSSRFGLNGSEDLGGGLKANFVLVGDFDPSTGTGGTGVFNRYSWVGLSGPFGEVKIGKMWSAYDDVQGAGAAGFNSNAFAPANDVWASNNYNDRPGNSISYWSPTVGGFSAAAFYSFGENKAAATSTTPAISAGHIASMNVKYEAGPVFVGLGYQVEKADSSVAKSTKYFQLNTSYDLGVVKLLGAIGQVKDGENGLATLSPAHGLAAIAVERSREYQLGVDIPFGAFTLSTGFAWSKDDQANGGPDVKHKGLGLVGKYELSKRTSLYAGFQMAKQSDDVGIPLVKTRVVAAGIKHTF